MESKFKELTYEMQNKAEENPFNQRIISGEISRQDYLSYVRQMYSIFKQIEENEIPHASLKRSDNLVGDIVSLGDLYYDALPATKEYVTYLKKLNKEKLNCHIYINYLDLLYKAQTIKNKLPGRGLLYLFENMDECVSSIVQLQKDEYADEINKGYEFIIKILDELQATSREEAL